MLKLDDDDDDDNFSTIQSCLLVHWAWGLWKKGYSVWDNNTKHETNGSHSNPTHNYICFQLHKMFQNVSVMIKITNHICLQWKRLWSCKNMGALGVCNQKQADHFGGLEWRSNISVWKYIELNHWIKEGIRLFLLLVHLESIWCHKFNKVFKKNLC